jgi:hypothetical protein
MLHRTIVMHHPTAVVHVVPANPAKTLARHLL